MKTPTYNVLFICTRNSARSILAEGLLNHMGGGRFKAFSAGSAPSGQVHLMAMEELQQLGIATDGLRSKGWDEFAVADAPVMDFVFTVCDQAAGETCPVWPGQPLTAHWGMPDPGTVEGPEATRRLAFRNAAITLKRRLELMMALPLPALDRMAIRQEITTIGNR
ncbi:arsenate reductase ArsC [Mitsuaria sp. 7]|uniref:arsenate reductase ArsC n=1 Tax=Mitsuaria sp. 7 TaxID=1658665 RepID=UPI0007DCDB63|nr:arsenate reductase ArsC [Mitsuaria sp. 7]ANH68250.1 arsenate reductase [Mitsuaria sp. 7]